MSKEWWLKEDCRKCDQYPLLPRCDFIETKSKKPRGCSLYQERVSGVTNEKEIINLKEYSDKYGISEVEVAKNFIKLLALKARITGITQHVIVGVTNEKEEKDV